MSGEREVIEATSGEQIWVFCQRLRLAATVRSRTVEGRINEVSIVMSPGDGAVMGIVQFDAVMRERDRVRAEVAAKVEAVAVAEVAPEVSDIFQVLALAVGMDPDPDWERALGALKLPAGVASLQAACRLAREQRRLTPEVWQHFFDACEDYAVSTGACARVAARGDAQVYVTEHVRTWAEALVATPTSKIDVSPRSLMWGWAAGSLPDYKDRACTRPCCVAGEPA